MNAKRISGALIVSLVIHGIIMLIASVSYITQTEQFKRAVSVEILQSKEPPISQVRKPVIKPVVQSQPSRPMAWQIKRRNPQK